MPINNSAAHTELVRAGLEALAMNGYTAWKTGAGGLRTDTTFIKFGKKGGGDITGILPTFLFIRGQPRTLGIHFEAEAKTGKGGQRKSQKLHQEFAVERNGGIYFVFRSVEELLLKMEEIKKDLSRYES